MRRLMTGKSWAANYTTTSRLPLHSSLGLPNTDYDPTDDSPLSHAAVSFVHGGLAPNYPDLTPFPSRINQLGDSLLYKLQHRNPPPAPHPPHAYPGLPADATQAEQQLYGTNGPLWYRGWALEPEEKVCTVVDDVLQRTGTRRMIMGHTPNFEVRYFHEPPTTASLNLICYRKLYHGVEERLSLLTPVCPFSMER